MEILDFQSKRWWIIGKVKINLTNDPSNLRNNYGCDIVIKDHTHYFMLNEIIDAQFEELP